MRWQNHFPVHLSQFEFSCETPLHWFSLEIQSHTNAPGGNSHSIINRLSELNEEAIDHQHKKKLHLKNAYLIVSNRKLMVQCIRMFDDVHSNAKIKAPFKFPICKPIMNAMSNFLICSLFLLRTLSARMQCFSLSLVHFRESAFLGTH